MSELLFESQESKTGPDRPPQYDPCQPSQDILTSVIENEYTRRILLQRLDNLGTELFNLGMKKATDTDYVLLEEMFQELGRLFTEGMHMTTELANVYKERVVGNTELYTAMLRLTVSEFDLTYASLRRDPNRQMRHSGYNSQHSLGIKQIEGAGSPCSCGRFFELSAKVDKINNQLGQSLQSHDTAKVWKTTHDTPAKPPRSFWKTILKHLSRP